MFIINITYIQPIAEIEKYLAEHQTFLEKYYQNDTLLLSGRKQPRTGGIVVALIDDRKQLDKILGEDPFYQHNLASYDVTEFNPTKYHPLLQPLFKS